MRTDGRAWTFKVLLLRAAPPPLALMCDNTMKPVTWVRKSAPDGFATAAGAAAAGAPAASAAAGAWRQTAADMLEGWDYVTAPENRDVAAFVFLRPSANLIWGGCDVLCVRCASLTLGPCRSFCAPHQVSAQQSLVFIQTFTFISDAAGPRMVRTPDNAHPLPRRI